jgi:hypothetical protein
MKLPPDSGYSVDSEGMIHRRHGHVAGARKARTAAAVEYLLDGRKGRICRTCYPIPERGLPSVQAPDKGQHRRVETDDQPVTSDETPTP